MGEIKVKEREVVVPGEELATGMDYLPSFGTYRDKNSILASKLGLVNVDGKVIKIIPLSGVYMPKRGDVIIGEVIDVLMSGWRVSFNSAYTAMLPISDASSEYINKGADLTKYFDIGDCVIGKVTNVTSQKLVDLSLKGPGLKKLRGGRIIKVNTTKVPRIIGKSGSMVSMIKQASGCYILVGQNGVVWIDGQPQGEVIAAEAIGMIERESHISGLTDRVRAFLEQKTGKKLDTGRSTTYTERSAEMNTER